MEALAKALLDGGPPFYLAIASILLNMGLLYFIRTILKDTRSENRDLIEALIRSTDAIDASADTRDEILDLVRTMQHGQEMSFAKNESMLSEIKSQGAKIETLLTISTRRTWDA